MAIYRGNGTTVIAAQAEPVVTEAELASSSGSSLVGHIGTGTGVTATTVALELNKLNQKPTGQYFANTGAKIQRLSDRVMAGDAVAYTGNQGETTGSWLFSQGAGTEPVNKMGWIEQNAIIAGVGSRGIGVTGASRTLAPQSIAIGVVAFAVAQGTTVNEDGVPVNKAWGAYIEAVKNNVGAGHAFGIEIDVTNLAPTVDTVSTPYSSLAVGGVTAGLWIVSGGDIKVNPVSYPANLAVGIGNNGNKFETGLVFTNTSLVRDGGATGRAHAIKLAYDHAIEWFEFTTQQLAFSIVSNVTDSEHKQELLVSDTGLRLRNATGADLFRANWVASAVNYPTISPAVAGAGVTYGAAGTDVSIATTILAKGGGSVFLDSTNGLSLQANAVPSAVNYTQVLGNVTGSPPQVRAAGTDTNIDLQLVPKGTGLIRFGTFTSNADAAINGYVTIKDAAGTTRKLATIA